MALDDTPPQPDDRYEKCPEDLMEAVKSIHHTVGKLDRAVTGDRFNPDLRPGLMVRVGRLEEHALQCNARADAHVKKERKRWSLPKKLALAGAVAAISAMAGAIGSKAVERWVGSSTSEPPSTAHR